MKGSFAPGSLPLGDPADRPADAAPQAVDWTGAGAAALMVPKALRAVHGGTLGRPIRQSKTPTEVIFHRGFLSFAPRGTRTPNQVIKSHLLYH